MTLDTRSLVYVNVAVFLVLGLAMLFIGRTRKTYPGFHLWVLGNFLIALGQLLLGLRSQIPDIFSTVAANILVSTYYVLIFEGMRRFLGRGKKWISPILFMLWMLAFLYFTYFDISISRRIIVTALFNALISAFVALEIMRSPSWKLHSVFRLNSYIFLFNCMVLVLRVIFVLTQPEIKDLFGPNPGFAASSLISISLSILWTFGIIFLTIDRLEQELIHVQEELQHLSICDSLTNAYNNRYFFEVGKNEVQQAQRYHLPMAVIALDIDQFKEVNDTYGHAKGNEVLIGLVLACRKCLREADILGRLGGDEFGVILSNTDLAESKIVAERLRETIADTLFPAGDSQVKVTASIGLAMVLDQDEGLEPSYQRADQALYEAKNHGRNAVAYSGAME